MHPAMTRKRFLFHTAAAAAASIAAPRLWAQTSPAPAIPDRGPQIESGLIKEFVIAGHANLDKVKELLAAQPALVNATWDWGRGDFETALGGASHMGRADIAEFLLSKNARLDLFAAAMLGKIEIVRAAVAAFPGIVKVPGPHKIPLLAHAEKGHATTVADFLKSVGA